MNPETDVLWKLAIDFTQQETISQGAVGADSIV